MTDEQVVIFIEWMLELNRPAYDTDTTRRFTPQLVIEGEDFVWIDTKDFSRYEPKFYTTQEILDLWKQHTGISGQQEKEPSSSLKQEN